MSDMVPQGSKYTDAQRKNAAVLFAVKGNLSVISRDTNIPRQTLADWRKTDWWDAIIGEVRQEKANEHIAKYCEIVDKAQEITLAKLDEATAAQASIIAATCVDKSLLLQGKATSISGKSTGGMEALLAKFEALSDEHRAQRAILDGSVVATQDANEND